LVRALVRLALVASFAALFVCAPALRADLDPSTAKKLAKLEGKLAKWQAKVDAAQAKHDGYALELIAAEAAQLAAQALPEGTLAEQKAKAKAVKAATKLIAKLGKKLVKWQGTADKHELKLQEIMQEIEVLVPGYFESGSEEEEEEDGSGDDGDGGDDGDDDPPEDDPLQPELALPLLQVDCGDTNGYDAPEDGWVTLDGTTAPPAVSLSPAPLDTVHVAHLFQHQGESIVGFPSTVMALDPDQVGERRKLTSLVLADPTTLSIGNLPADSQVRVLLELGATAPWVELVNGAFTALVSATKDLRVEVDGPAPGAQYATVAQGLRCGTSLQSASLYADSGSILPLWVLGTTDANGVLRLRLSADGEHPVLLAAFAVYRHEPLPIVYRRTAAGPLQGSAPAAAAFVTAFNAGDADGAELLAHGLQDPLLRGVALLHVAGWLDGGRDERRHLFPDARAALLLAQAAGHAAASVLLEQLSHVERAYDHFDARGYSDSFDCASEGGKGFLNPECADQIYAKLGQADSNVNFHIGIRELRGLTAGALGPNALWDLAAWNTGALGADEYEPSPLVWLALKQTGIALTAMNPMQHSNPADPDSVASVQASIDVFDGFRDLGFAATDFPRDLELPLYAAYVDSGEHLKDWDAGELDLFTEEELQESWWGPELLAFADDPAAPSWANAQRHVQRALRLFIGEWFERRLRNDELGGGQGDDVELLLQFFPLLASRRDGGERLLASRLDDLVHFGLEESGSVVDGYWAGQMADVEHTGEYATDPFITAYTIFGSTARTAALGGTNGRHLLQPLDPDEAFAGTTATGRTHMRSFHYTTEGPSDEPSVAVDVFLNGRALIPALTLAQRGSLGTAHPLVTDQRAWAAGWRDDALLAPGAAGGKPLGFPAAAQWPSNALGAGGLWYTHKGIAGDDSQWTTGEVSYVLGQLHLAWAQSAAADRWQYLLPALRMFRTVMAWEDAGEPAGSIGGTSWAASRFRDGGRFGSLVLQYQPALAADPVLTVTPDPALGGATTYVDAALLARLRAWLVTDFTDQGNVLRYALETVGTCAGHQLKSSALVTELFENALRYYRTAWPLLARHVMHTDRVAASPFGVQRELLAAWTGARIAEGLPWMPLVRWSGEDLDLSVLTNHRDEAGTRWSAFVYNFAATPAAATLVLEQGLQPGTWLLEAGPAVPTCDVFPGSLTSSLPVTKRGLSAATSLTLPPGLSLVRLTRTGSATAAATFDLVLDPPRLSGSLEAGAVATARVANAGLSAAPSSNLHLYVAAVDASGALAAPAALPEELLLASATVTLGGASGFVLPEQTCSFPLPAGSPLLDLLAAGYGLQLRAEVPATAAEWDPANNGQARCWFAADLATD
jgi:hypothetical protein